MSIGSKWRAAKSAWNMIRAVRGNTGVIPAACKGMVTIELTSVCNLACPLCPTGTGTLRRDRKFISVEDFDRIIELTRPFAAGYVLSVFGEPTMHPEIGRLLERVRHDSAWLSTNLNYGANRIRELSRWENLHVICSVDTLDPVEYPKYRINGDHATVLANLRLLAKGACNVYPQFLVEPGKYDEGSFIEFAREFGIPVPNVVVKTKLEEFRLDATEKPVSGPCHSPYTALYFNCDGHMVPCCNNVRSELYMTHVSEIASLDDILSGPRAVRMRRQLAQDKNVFESCGRCKGHDFWQKEFREYLAALRSLTGRRRPDDKPTRMHV